MTMTTKLYNQPLPLDNASVVKLPNYFWGDSGSFLNCLVVSTHLKNTSQNGNLPQIGVKIKHI